MSQEKKNIRLLTPTKKSKKISPLASGMIGVAVGISATSLAFFAYLNQNTFSTQAEQIEVNNQNPNDKELLANHDRLSEETDEQSEPDEYHQTQPKINELNNIFKHQAAPAVIQNNQVSNTNNPFDNALGNINQPTPASSANKTSKVESQSKTNTAEKLPQTIKKPVELATSSNSNKEVVIEEKKPTNEDSIETAVANIQLAITRSEKEKIP